MGLLKPPPEKKSRAAFYGRGESGFLYAVKIPGVKRNDFPKYIDWGYVHKEAAKALGAFKMVARQAYIGRKWRSYKSGAAAVKDFVRENNVAWFYATWSVDEDDSTSTIDILYLRPGDPI